VYGEQFPALPRFGVPDAAAAELVASQAARAALLGGDGLAPLAWLQRTGLVRAAAARLDDVLTAADAVHGGLAPAEIAVWQLPHAPGDRWLGLPLAGGTPPRGSLSIVAHVPGGVDPRAPLAGLAVDRFAEALPATTQTTGVGLQFDAPGSRAPQAILIAVPPDPAQPAWDFDSLVASVREARELSRIRLVDVQSVTAGGRLLPALWMPFNVDPGKPSLDLIKIEGLHVHDLNVAWSAAHGGNP
jgi:hypothetical protein